MRHSLHQFGLKTTSAIFAVAIHVVLAALLFSNLDFDRKPQPQVISVTPIQSSLISDEDLQAAEKQLKSKDLEKQKELEAFEKQKKELVLARQKEQKELERIKQQRKLEERKAEEAETRLIEAEKQRKLEEIEGVKQEQRRLDENKKKREQEAIQKKERAKKEQEQNKLTEEKRKKDAAEKKRQAEAAAETERKKLEEEARKKKQQAEKQQREKEMQQRLKEEQSARIKHEAEQAFASVEGEIRRRVELNWIPPSGLRSGLKAVLVVKVAPNGEVLNVVIRQSSGDSIYDRSVQNAILKTSPLPIPQNPQYYPHYSEFVLNFVPPENS